MYSSLDGLGVGAFFLEMDARFPINLESSSLTPSSSSSASAAAAAAAIPSVVGVVGVVVVVCC